MVGLLYLARAIAALALVAVATPGAPQQPWPTEQALWAESRALSATVGEDTESGLVEELVSPPLPEGGRRTVVSKQGSQGRAV